MIETLVIRLVAALGGAVIPHRPWDRGLLGKGSAGVMPAPEHTSRQGPKTLEEE